MTSFEILQIITGFLGSLGFTILYNIRGKRLIFTAIGALLSCTLLVLLKFIIPDEALRYFLISVFISIYAEVLARLIKTPTTTFLITALMPLIPGGSLYYTMVSAFDGDAAGFMVKGLYTFRLAVALALGIVLTAALTKMLLHAIRVVKKQS